MEARKARKMKAGFKPRSVWCKSSVRFMQINILLLWVTRVGKAGGKGADKGHLDLVLTSAMVCTIQSFQTTRGKSSDGFLSF